MRKILFGVARLNEVKMLKILLKIIGKIRNRNTVIIRLRAMSVKEVRKIIS